MAKGLYTPQNCVECSKAFKSVMSLARHLTQAHRLTTQQYFDKHLKIAGNGVCCNCRSQTKFLNLSSGYQKVCGHSCATIVFRAEQKADQVRHSKFTSNIAKSQAAVWKNRSAAEKKRIMDKIMDSPGWKGRVQISPEQQLSLQLERIGLKDCKHFGIDPGNSAWITSQAVINENLAQTLEMSHG